MRRDTDRIRQLLMEIEDRDTANGEGDELALGETDTLVALAYCSSS